MSIMNNKKSLSHQYISRYANKKRRQKMKGKTKIIVIGACISIVFLLSFGYLQEKEAKFLSLSSQWLFISIMPVLVSLFVGGYITKLKGFGLELESALKESVSTSIDLKASDAIANILGDKKQSMFYLANMPREKALSIKWLVFELGRINYYTPNEIRKYLYELPNIEFLEVHTRIGQFICYIPKSYFIKEGDTHKSDYFDLDKIQQFIYSIEESNVQEKFRGIAISVMVNSSDSLVQVLKVLREEQVNMAAVISEKSRYLGVIFSRDVERKVADAVLKSQPT
jgi:hypothetical protein